MTPSTSSGKRDGSNSCATGPCSRPTSEENTGVARTVKAAIDWLERRGAKSDPFLLWLDLFSPHGPWDPPQPYRDQYVTVEPDEFEAGEEGDLVEETNGRRRRRDRHRRRHRPDRRSSGSGRRRAQRGRAVPLAANLRRHRDPGRPLAGRAFRGPRPAGPDGRYAAGLHERPGGAAGRARIRPPVPALALRRADPHAA